MPTIGVFISTAAAKNGLVRLYRISAHYHDPIDLTAADHLSDLAIAFYYRGVYLRKFALKYALWFLLVFCWLMHKPMPGVIRFGDVQSQLLPR
ncbi:hypothetical protein LFZ31_20515 [Salmonella enterica subsp. enterica serovar Newport str. S09097]|nr:hypothetical protein LFZ31_20515 [Salmonella enterica subsp. enterica serovar Newport str. S09097]